MFGIITLENGEFFTILRLFSSSCYWRSNRIDFESIWSHANTFFHSPIEILKLFFSIVVDRISTYKCRRSCWDISMLIEFEKDTINFIFSIFHLMMLLNLIWVDTFIVIINIYFILIFLIMKKIRPFHTIQLEIFLLENIPILLFFIIKSIDKADKLIFLFFVSF